MGEALGSVPLARVAPTHHNCSFTRRPSNRMVVVLWSIPVKELGMT
jgi:hypothetical protein